jgi:hypothetical protein
VALDSVETAPIASPAKEIDVVAAACVRFTTFGTATGPVDTTNAIAEPACTPVPAFGLWLITLPAGTVVLDDCEIVPSTSPAVVIAVVASTCVKFSTLGTGTVPGAGAGPVDTTRFTAEPAATPTPATGFWLLTRPAGTVALDCCVTVPTTSPAPVTAVVAVACV